MTTKPKASTPSRPIHPFYNNVFPSSGNADQSLFAYITTARPYPTPQTKRSSICIKAKIEEAEEYNIVNDESYESNSITTTPNLVTSIGSTLYIYNLPNLELLQSYTTYGNINSIQALHHPGEVDALLLSFSGYPRFSIIQVQQNVLRSICLFDLSSILQSRACGYSMTNLYEEDAMIVVGRNGGFENKRVNTGVAVLAGGVVMVIFDIERTVMEVENEDGSMGTVRNYSILENYHVLDWSFEKQNVVSSIQQKSKTQQNVQNLISSSAILSPYGEILDVVFLTEYSTPTIAILHIPRRVNVGQIHKNSYKKYSTSVTTLSINTNGNIVELWNVSTLPWDTKHLKPIGSTIGILLAICTNGITLISNYGQRILFLCVNGFSHASFTYNNAPHKDVSVMVNEPLLDITLDAMRILYIKSSKSTKNSYQFSKTALCILQNGHMYALHIQINSFNNYVTCMKLRKLPFIYEPGIVSTICNWKNLLFVGSVYGDCILFQLRLQLQIKEEEEEQTMEEVAKDTEELTELEREEMELYDGYTTTEETIEEDGALLASNAKQRLFEHKFTSNIHIILLSPISYIPALGPLGKSAYGPLPSTNQTSLNQSQSLLYPCGYGVSGGIAIFEKDCNSIIYETDVRSVNYVSSTSDCLILHRSVYDGGQIVLRQVCDTSEDDGVNKKSKISWMECNVTFPKDDAMEEDDTNDVETIWKNSNLLLLHEYIDLNQKLTFWITLLHNTKTNKYYIMTFRYNHTISFHSCQEFATTKIINKTTKTPIKYKNCITFGCIYNDGSATIIVLHYKQNDINVQYIPIPLDSMSAIDIFLAPKDLWVDDIIHPQQEEEDIDDDDASINVIMKDITTDTIASTIMDETQYEDTNDDDLSYDQDDYELYNLSNKRMKKSARVKQSPTTDDQQPLSSPISIAYSSYSITSERLYVAVCAKNMLSIMQIDFHDDDDTVELNKTPVWYTYGCGYGYSQYPILNNPNDTKSEDDDDDEDESSLIQEISFFYCTNYIKTTNQATSKITNLVSVLNTNKTKTFHFILLTSNYDVHYYTLYPTTSTITLQNKNNLFLRSSIGNKVTRKSLECSKYYMKLVRRHIVGNKNENLFQYGLLYKFDNIQGRSGCFVNVSRPLWFYSQREIFYHTMKHASPNGILGNSHQGVLTGFSSVEYLNGSHGFVTLHERIGRVGSQRLTLYSSVSSDLEISTYNQSLTKTTNSGYKISKIPLGVTVRQISFLNSITLSTPSHPLYILLISRIIEEDNPFYTYNDSLTHEERKQIEEKKEQEKMKRQVEADLGGFDLEQEWVEEIERDDCFVVNKELGGIPKLKKEVHEIWLMDSSRFVDDGEQQNEEDEIDESNFGDWKLLDKFELKEYEHGMVLKVMNLSEVAENASHTAAAATTDDDTNHEMKYFITVGTGVLDQDGEDVSSKGRILFLEVVQNTIKEQQVQKKLSLVYEKDIFLGPVTALSCLETDGKNRLVVGAGAEVTVEQWGADGKLTQVGFFHANMQIQDINIFKTFLLLADAYDSLHFLVWRESDKSLTLLAKDYEPIAVYASGLLCRGSAMYFICHDDRQNFQFFNYAPTDEASRGGNKLVCRADFHLGVQTISLDGHYCRNSLLVHSSTPNSTMTALKQHDTLFGRADDDIRFGVHFGTGDGGFGCIIPVNEQTYWRLTALQSVMSNALENSCGLSHRAWRLYRRSARRGGCRGNDRKRGVLDGTILFRFVDLNLIQQEELASAIGSTVNLIMDNLLELECASMV